MKEGKGHEKQFALVSAALLLSLCLGACSDEGTGDTKDSLGGTTAGTTHEIVATTETTTDSSDESSSESGFESGFESGSENDSENDSENETAHEHIPVPDLRVEPTCGESGLTEGSHCSECGEVLTVQEVIPATNQHIYDANGFCSTCGAEKPKPTEGLEYTLNDEGTAYGVSGIGTATAVDIVIPETYEGLPVTSISRSAFSDCSSLTSIAIPGSVTSIGDDVFFGCKSLASITVYGDHTVYHTVNHCLIETASGTLIAGCKNSVIPIDGSVTSIGESAFYEQTGLTGITIPDSVMSIGSFAFSSCTSLISITIPDGVTSIADETFRNCTGLTSITIPNGMTSIGYEAFSWCTGLASVVIPNSVTSLTWRPFANCPGLKSITFYGTTAEWQTLAEAASMTAPTYTVYCTDGQISKDGTVTPNA